MAENLRPRNNSSAALRAIMRDDKLSKTVRDAINSPIGSTSRTRAQQILSVLKKARKDDGFTAPGMQGPAANRPRPAKKPRSAGDFSNLMVLPRAPKPKFSLRTGKRLNDGAGGPGDLNQAGSISSMFGNVPQADSGGFKLPELPEREPFKPSGTFFQDVYGGAQELAKDVYKIFGGGRERPKTPTLGEYVGETTPNLLGRGAFDRNAERPESFFPELSYRTQGGQTSTQQPGASSQPSNMSVAPGASTAPPMSTVPGQGGGQPPMSVAPGGQKETTKTTTTKTSPDGTKTETVKESEKPSGQQQPGGQTTGTQAQVGGQQQPGAQGQQLGGQAPGTQTAGTQPQPGGQQPQGAPQRFPSLQDAVQSAVSSNIGPTGFAMDVMQNPEKYGLSDAYGGGMTLSERVQKIDDTLRQQYELDSMLNQQQELIQQGVGLEGRLTDYIRGRDQFLNETNDMIEDFKDRLPSMDLGNPAKRESANSYMNFLYELRGRQNKRYIEFLNQGINEYNGRLEAMGNMYNNALDAYERELSTKSSIAQEEYNLMYNALSEMYENVKNAPKEAMEMQLMQAEINATNAKAVQDSVEQYNLQDFDETWKSLKTINAIDDRGRWNDNVTLGDVESMSSMGIDPRNAFQAMKMAGKNSLVKGEEEGFAPGLEDMTETAGNLFNSINELEQAGLQAGDPNTVNMAEGARQEIRNAYANAIFQNGHLTEEHAPVIREAVNYLARSRPGVFNFSEVPTRAQFIEGFEGQIPREFLDAIYNDFEGFKDKPEEFAKYSLNYVEEGEPVQALSDRELVRSLANSVASKVTAGF